MIPTPGYLRLPPELTGVDADIIVILGERFPMIGAQSLAPILERRRESHSGLLCSQVKIFMSIPDNSFSKGAPKRRKGVKNILRVAQADSSKHNS